MSVASDVSAPSGSHRPLIDRVRLFVAITRPKVMALVVFTGLPAVLLGQSSWPEFSKVFWVLFGTAMAGAASSSFNAYVERDADARMARTRRRPLPAALLLPRVVLFYGVFLTVLSSVVLFWMGGWGAMGIGLGTIAFYVGVYTLWLKPRTPQNIVIGGAAGSTAPLIASVAMTGDITTPAWILFLIIFLWTPPHFWGVAIYRRDEYEAAGFPMMPSVVGNQGTRWRSLGYTLLLLPVTYTLVAWGYLGWVYGVSAVLLGVWFLYLVVKALIEQRTEVDYAVFKGSIVYLSLLFLAIFVDLAMTVASS
jgi:protoheme IX farnesyltransferase